MCILSSNNKSSNKQKTKQRKTRNNETHLLRAQMELCLLWKICNSWAAFCVVTPSSRALLEEEHKKHTHVVWYACVYGQYIKWVLDVYIILYIYIMCRVIDCLLFWRRVRALCVLCGASAQWRIY